MNSMLTGSLNLHLLAHWGAERLNECPVDIHRDEPDCRAGGESPKY